MSGMKSKRKGKLGEREIAAELSRLFGVECRRGVQFQGSPDSPDVVGLPGFHVEVKRSETFSPYAAMEQAKSDSADGIPIVLHRQNGRKWLAVIELDSLPDAAVKLFHVLGMKGTE